MDDPTIGLVAEPKQSRKKALAKAAKEHEGGKPRAAETNGQDRLDGTTPDKAWEDYKDTAAEYAQKAQVWKDAQERRDVRLDDLVKVHAHKPFDQGAAANVSKQAAKAVQQEKDALAAKQEAKKALDAAWTTVQSFNENEPIRPLIPDDE